MRLVTRISTAVLALASTSVLAHARWPLDGTVRPRSNESGLKEPAPCGGKPATTFPGDRKAFDAGATVTLQWEETVNHPGHYRIAFSPDGTSGYDANVLLDNITDIQVGPVPHLYTASVTLPTTLCETCSLQLIQYMSDSGNNYYSCADIRIVTPGTADDPPPAGPTSPSSPEDPTADPVPATPTGTKPAAPTGLTVKAIEQAATEGDDAKAE